MTKTLTTDRLKQITDAISAEPHDYESIYDSIKHGEIAAMARELLANREAQPMGEEEINAALRLHRLKVEGHSQLSDSFRAGFKYARRTAPPAPAVVKLPRAFYSDEGLMVPLEKVMASLAVCGIEYEHGGSTCRAAMLAAAPEGGNDA